MHSSDLKMQWPWPLTFLAKMVFQYNAKGGIFTAHLNFYKLLFWILHLIGKCRQHRWHNCICMEWTMTMTLVYRPFSRTTLVSQYQNVSIIDFIGAKDEGSGSNSWMYKSCKAPVKMSPPTNQHPVFFRPDALPVAQSTVSKHWRETITFHGVAHPKLTWEFSVLVLTTKSCWLPWISVAKLLINPVTGVPVGMYL